MGLVWRAGNARAKTGHGTRNRTTRCAREVMRDEKERRMKHEKLMTDNIGIKVPSLNLPLDGEALRQARVGIEVLQKIEAGSLTLRVFNSGVHGPLFDRDFVDAHRK